MCTYNIRFGEVYKWKYFQVGLHTIRIIKYIYGFVTSKLMIYNHQLEYNTMFAVKYGINSMMEWVSDNFFIINN